GLNNTAVAARLDTDRGTVSRWRTRFLQRRLDDLSDEPRAGVPRTITDAQVEEVAVRTLEEAPEGATHWSKRELARRVGISPTSVLRIWRAFGLQPWRTETFNQVERWFAELQRRCLERGVFCSLDELETALEDWIKTWNSRPGLSSGPRPQTRSSTASAATATGSPDRDTRASPPARTAAAAASV
ncbi:helix-turn-helix domain-containing protein, partial [Streptomyces rishiriensis]|uniref:helix-turn-helix domain-containing protein n=1 Tax=Streptomyces rishiriensis TaxID=68264 RepID=UPI003F4CD321